MLNRLQSAPRTLLLAALSLAFLTLGLTLFGATRLKLLDTDFDLAPGLIVGAGHDIMTLEALDLTPEPGEIVDDTELARFYERQGQLANILDSESVSIKKDQESIAVAPRNVTLGDLSHVFWIQIVVGLGALVISAWVWALKNSLATRLFALSGLSTLMFTFSAAIYTTRPLAIHAPFFKVLTFFNPLGASLFGIFTLALFLVYPMKVKGWKFWISLESVIFGIWTGLSVAGVLPASYNVNFVTLVEMIGICLALLAQFFATRSEPQARASLTWLGLAVLIGAGSFIALNATPLVFGLEVGLSQAYAFLFFLVIYLGLAAGLVRYRLFEVGKWAYSLLFYAIGAIVLVALDAALVLQIGVDKLPALGLSLLLLGIFYLPLRDFLWRLVDRRKQLKPHELLGEAMQVALAPSLTERSLRWENLIKKFYDPLETIFLAEDIKEVVIATDGLTMLLPPVAECRGLKISYPWGGKALFNSESKDLAIQMIALVEQAEASRKAYDRGVQQERKRMAQDLHDDVGARLLTGIHMAGEDMKPTLQAALADIRSIVSEMNEEKVELSSLLAESRHEVSKRLAFLNVELDWPVDQNKTYSDIKLDYAYQKVIRSGLREIVSNVIHHAKATKVEVRVAPLGCDLNLTLVDNGCGFNNEKKQDDRKGYGLTSLKRRLENMGGSLQIDSTKGRTQVVLRVPCLGGF